MTPDEELQQQTEQGNFSALHDESLDVKAYREVFRALKKEPDYSLPPNFAHNVVARLEHRHKKSISFDYLWFGSGIVLLLTSLIVALSYTSFKIDFGFLNNIAPLKGVIIFGIAFILILNWLDYRFVKGKRTT